DSLHGMEEHYIAVLDGSIAGAEEWPLQSHKVVSVDIPSGLCSQTGTILKGGKYNYGRCIRADMTVTFHSKKPGHVLRDGPQICGEVVVKDIGL
ncbi:NAD(P)H-hydrate epimerase, partial [Litoreibacter halocynthiae]|uniref:NAD(P)H-hydrate epimerase n=1 Tax=Litoreibacter halocynthiae TaxID=1242689 RepID=UPI002490F3FB